MSALLNHKQQNRSIFYKILSQTNAYFKLHVVYGGQKESEQLITFYFYFMNFLKINFFDFLIKNQNQFFEMIKRLLHLFTKTSEQKMQKFPLH